MVPNIKEQKFFNIKDLIMVVGFVITIAASWFAQQNRINTLEGRLLDVEKVLDKNDLSVINYKLDALIKSFDNFIAEYKADKAAGHN